MADYGLYYQGGWSSVTGEQGYISINKLDYEGEVTPFQIAADSIVIRYNFEDWNSPIIGLQAEFEIVNNKTDFFDLLSLLSAEEKEFQVVITGTTPNYGATLFEGYLNVQTGTTKYLKYQNLHLSASNYLYKLDDVHPVDIDTLQNMNFITIIQKILEDTGGDFDIRVNSLLHAEGETLDGAQTLFNKNACSTELFWVDNVEKMASLQILKTILTTFDCYIYWHDRFWYIERYEDIWQASINYVLYQHNVDYLLPTDVGVTDTIVRATADVHDLVFTEQSQQIAIIPGLKTIKLNLDDKRMANLTNGDLSKITEVSSGIPNPGLRAWEYIDDSEVNWDIPTFGKPKSIITSSVHRWLTLILPTETYKGIYTKFKVSVDNATVQLNIQFKYVVNERSLSNWTNGTWKDFTFLFHWYLQVLPLGGLIFKSNKTDDTGGKWYMKIGSPEDSFNEIEAPGTDFDKASSSYSVSLSIPLGEVIKIESGVDTGPLLGDFDMLLCIGIETVKINDSDFRNSPAEAWIGDIVISTTGDNQENVIEGKVNTKFLDKKEIALSLYDCESYNYKNAILRGTDYLIRTEKWGTGADTNNFVQKGICWKIGSGSNPVITDAHTDEGSGTDSFSSLMTGLDDDTEYSVRAYYKDAVGTVFYGNELELVTLTLQIGQYYQGGLIAFFFEAGDAGYVAGEVHGMIVATQDQGLYNVWCMKNADQHTVGATATEIGDGAANTALMLAETGNVGLYAAKVCYDYSSDGHEDWFLPSDQELYHIFISQLTIPMGFTRTWYWTSSEKPTAFLTTHWKYAYAINFSAVNAGPSNVMGEFQKWTPMGVRPVRNF